MSRFDFHNASFSVEAELKSTFGETYTPALDNLIARLAKALRGKLTPQQYIEAWDSVEYLYWGSLDKFKRAYLTAVCPDKRFIREVAVLDADFALMDSPGMLWWLFCQPGPFQWFFVLIYFMVAFSFIMVSAMQIWGDASLPYLSALLQVGLAVALAWPVLLIGKVFVLMLGDLTLVVFRTSGAVFDFVKRGLQTRRSSAMAAIPVPAPADETGGQS